MRAFVYRLYCIMLSGFLLVQTDIALAQDRSEPEGVAQQLEFSDLVILSGGNLHNFTVELADEPEERRKGMMFRYSVEADRGMLFRFDRPQRAAMWMKNTYISLDILFIQQDGIIVNIAQDTEPHSLPQIASKGRVIGVLELKAGVTEELGIKPGDRVLHAIFGD